MIFIGKAAMVLKKNKTLIWSILGIAMACLFFKCFYGFDWSDESYYIELIARISAGDRFFIDVTDPHQLVAVIGLPFYYFWNIFLSDFIGIILYFRIVYTMLECCLLIYVYRTLKFSEYPLLIIPILACACFSQFSIRSVSYNTISYLCVFASAITVLSKYSLNSKAIIIGVLLTVATCVYPSLLVLWLLFLVCFSYQKQFKKYCIASVAAGTVLLLIIIMHTDLSNIVNGLTNMFATYANDRSDSILQRLMQAFAYFPMLFVKTFTVPGIIFFSLSNCLLRLFKANERIVTVNNSVIIAVLACYILVTDLGHLDDNMYFILAMVLFIQLLFSNIQQSEKNTLLFMAAASFIYYLCVYALTDVPYNVITYTYLLLFVSEIAIIGNGQIKIDQRMFSIQNSLLTIVILMAIGINVFSIYRDKQIPYLTQKLTEGPAAGIYTTPQRAQDYANTISAIDQYANCEGKIVFARLLPWGYMETDMKPGVSSVWRYYSEDEIDKETSVIIIVNDDVGITNKYDYTNSSIRKYIEDNDMKMHETDCCRVYITE